MSARHIVAAAALLVACGERAAYVDTTAAGDTTPRAPSAATGQFVDPCGGAGDAGCVARAERAAIAASHGRVERRGDTLVFHAGGKRDVVFANDTSSADAFAIHEYLGSLPGLPYDLVRRNWYEGWGYLAVHQTTGDTTQLDAIPLIAPGRARLLAASMDLDAGEEPNRVSIFRIEPAGLRLEWQQETADIVHNTGWGADDARWLDSTTIEATRVVPSTEGVAHPAGRVRITRAAGSWRVDSVAGAAGPAR